MNETYRCGKCDGQWFRVNTELEGKVIVACNRVDGHGYCDHRVTAPTVTEAFQAIAKKEEAKKP